MENFFKGRDKYLKGVEIFFENILLKIPLKYTLFDLIIILENIFKTKKLNNFKIFISDEKIISEKNILEKIEIGEIFEENIREFLVVNNDLKIKISFKKYFYKARFPKIFSDNLREIGTLNKNFKIFFRTKYKISKNYENSEKNILEKKIIKIKKVNGKKFEKTEKKSIFKNIFQKIKKLVSKN